MGSCASFAENHPQIELQQFGWWEAAGAFNGEIFGSRVDHFFYQTYGPPEKVDGEFRKSTLTKAYKEMWYLEVMANDAAIAKPNGTVVKNSFARAVSDGVYRAED